MPQISAQGPFGPLNLAFSLNELDAGVQAAIELRRQHEANMRQSLEHLHRGLFNLGQFNLARRQLGLQRDEFEEKQRSTRASESLDARQLQLQEFLGKSQVDLAGRSADRADQEADASIRNIESGIKTRDETLRQRELEFMTTNERLLRELDLSETVEERRDVIAKLQLAQNEFRNDTERLRVENLTDIEREKARVDAARFEEEKRRSGVDELLAFVRENRQAEESAATTALSKAQTEKIGAETKQVAKETELTDVQVTIAKKAAETPENEHDELIRTHGEDFARLRDTAIALERKEKGGVTEFLESFSAGDAISRQINSGQFSRLLNVAQKIKTQAPGLSTSAILKELQREVSADDFAIGVSRFTVSEDGQVIPKKLTGKPDASPKDAQALQEIFSLLGFDPAAILPKGK